MKYLKWTKEQNDFLKEQYAEDGLKSCAASLKIPIKKVKAHIEKLRLKKKRNLIQVAEGHKLCSDCGEIKTLENFARDGSGHRADCKPCNSDKSKSYLAQNKNKAKAAKKIYVKKNREKINARSRDYRRTPEYKLKLLAYAQRPYVKIKMNLRNRLGHLCRGRKSGSTQELVGCSWQELTNYLASKFSPGMTWENYGKWHVDHIIACAKFDLSNPEEQAKCFHHSNLQPLWAKDNLIKGAT